MALFHLDTGYRFIHLETFGNNVALRKFVENMFPCMVTFFVRMTHIETFVTTLPGMVAFNLGILHGLTTMTMRFGHGISTLLNGLRQFVFLRFDCLPLTFPCLFVLREENWQ